MLEEPQLWMLVGVLGATVAGVVTAVMTVFHRTLESSVGGLRADVDYRLATLQLRVETQLDAVEARLGRIDACRDAPPIRTDDDRGPQGRLAVDAP